MLAGLSFLVAVFRSRTFVVLLGLDLLFIVLHVATMEFLANGGTTLWSSFHPDPWLRLDRDRSASEWYEAMKMIVAAGLLIQMARAGLGRSLHVLALVALYMTADNILRIHERVGRLLGGPGPERHTMEFLYMVAVGLGIIGTLAWCFARTARELRPVVFALGFAILMLGGAAAVLDASHMVLGEHGKLFDTMFTLMEDGSELIAQSVFLGCAVVAYRERTSAPLPVSQLARA